MHIYDKSLDQKKLPQEEKVTNLDAEGINLVLMSSDVTKPQYEDCPAGHGIPPEVVNDDCEFVNLKEGLPEITVSLEGGGGLILEQALGSLGTDLVSSEEGMLAGEMLDETIADDITVD